MGASAWSYVVPYQDSIEKALQQLQNELFAAGQYVLVDDYWQDASFEEYLETMHPSGFDTLDGDDRAMYQRAFDDLRARPKPTTIEALLERNGPEGTSSILDMRGVSATPRFAYISPVASDQVHALFGTITPTRRMVELLDRSAYANLLEDTWQGVYLIVYDQERPTEIFFYGISGD